MTKSVSQKLNFRDTALAISSSKSATNSSFWTFIDVERLETLLVDLYAYFWYQVRPETLLHIFDHAKTMAALMAARSKHTNPHTDTRFFFHICYCRTYMGMLVMPHMLQKAAAISAAIK